LIVPVVAGKKVELSSALVATNKERKITGFDHW
jgi:hypothetical protein